MARHTSQFLFACRERKFSPLLIRPTPARDRSVRPCPYPASRLPGEQRQHRGGAGRGGAGLPGPHPFTQGSVPSPRQGRVWSENGGGPWGAAPAESAPRLVTEDVVTFPRPLRDSPVFSCPADAAGRRGSSVSPCSPVWRGRRWRPPQRVGAGGRSCWPLATSPFTWSSPSLRKSIISLGSNRKLFDKYLKNTNIWNFRCH